MRYIYTIVSLISSVLFDTVFADQNAGILGGPGMNEARIREGNIGFSQIPGIIKYATDFILTFAATIAVIMIIYGAFQMSLMGLTAEDKKQGSSTIQHGIIGFVVAVSAWFIINVIIANL